MPTTGRPRTDILSGAFVVAVALGAAAMALLRPDQTMILLAGAALAALLVFAALRWEITAWAWLWVLAYGVLDSTFWRGEVPGFFNLTIPRLLFVAAVLAFTLHFAFRRRPVLFDRTVLWVMWAMLVYCAISATAYGWSADSDVILQPPYFRFIGGLMFPAVMFFLMYNAARNERQVSVGLFLIFIFGWYALYIGYLQYLANAEYWAGARDFIFPAYINNPEVEAGIHFARSRGPFYSAAPQGALLVFLFFVDMFLIRRSRGFVRVLAAVQALLVVPGIFFTSLRAAYLCFLICGLIWLIWGGRRGGVLKLASGLVALLLLTGLFWQNLQQSDRLKGGVAEVSPIEDRIALLKITWQIAQEHPFTGVGYGRFAEARQSLEQDPTTRSLPPEMMQHNVFLAILAETGILGLVLLVGILVLMFRESLQLYRKMPPDAHGLLSRPLVVLFWVALANYITISMFNDTTTDFFTTGLTWTLAGLVVGYNRLLEPHRIDLPSYAPAHPEATVVPG
ncbi:MAG: O-antigen ligase family protein [Planctomycetaceae bacterium]|nr:O-antigen ligase family protein [Planctomycetaceae bacterium]